MSTIKIGNKFSINQLGSLGLTGFKFAVLNEMGEKVVYIKRGKKLSVAIEVFADEKMTKPLLTLANGTMADNANNTIGAIQAKMLISKSPLTVTTPDGVIVEIRTTSLFKLYIRNMGYTFVPVIYQLFVNDGKIATFTMPLTLSKSKLLCELEDTNNLDRDIFVLIGSVLILGY